MMNMIQIDGYKAIFQFDPEIEMFRVEFVGINGGADFYASDVESLKKEAKASLEVFLDMCCEDGINPRKEYSGKLNLRLPPETHESAVLSAIAEGVSLNQWLKSRIEESL